MKQLLKNLFRSFGFDIVKYSKDAVAERKSVRTNSVSLYETATGRFYLPDDAHEDVVVQAIKNNEIFEKIIVDTAAEYIKKDTVVLDVGANFGQMSILFSQLVGEKGRVYSFDADDFVFDILKKNIKANNKEDRITPIFGAVYFKDNETLIFPVQDFDKFGSYGSYGIDYSAKSGREVKTVTIDSLQINDPISFMKIDIQGSDLLAMKGAVKTIEKHKMPILFEYEYQLEEDSNLSFQEYVDFVQSINYRFDKVINGVNFLIKPKQ
jgi:FkbM family methyltransferase